MPSRATRIALLSVDDPRDRRSFSGTLSAIASSLERHCGDVELLGPLETRSSRVRKGLSGAVRRVSGIDPRLLISERYFRQVGRIASERIAGSGCDVVVVVAARQRWLTAHLETDLAIVRVDDATNRRVRNYYPRAGGRLLPERKFRLVEQAERITIMRASHSVFSSAWAASSAIDDYGADPERVHMIPFGANFSEHQDAERLIEPPTRQRCELLLVGKNWKRKGGAIALDALRALRRHGVEATLTVVGCRPPGAHEEPGLHVIERLDKNNPAEERRLRELYRNAHFLILPTRADFVPMVLAEANSFGVPALTTDTGGIPSAVSTGINGWLFEPDEDGTTYAAVIEGLIAEPDRYRELCATSRRRAETELNWDAWGIAMNRVITAALDERT